MTDEITQLEKALYTAKSHTTGGRDGGASRASDGHGNINVVATLIETGAAQTQGKRAL